MPLLLSGKSSFYFLDVKPLSDRGFVNIFSHSVCCLFTSLIVPFEVQKVFIFMKSIVSIFSLVPCALGIISKKSFPNPRSQRLRLCFLLRIIVQALTFRPLVHFELTFVYGIGY